MIVSELYVITDSKAWSFSRDKLLGEVVCVDQVKYDKCETIDTDYKILCSFNK